MSDTKSKAQEKNGEEKTWEDESVEKEKVAEVQNIRDRKSSTDSYVLGAKLESTSAENELIDLDDVELSDEDTWLYTSPKNLTKEEKEFSPYKWLRKDVEDPTNQQLQMAKSALVSKLDELDILDQSANNSDIIKEVGVAPSFENQPKTVLKLEDKCDKTKLKDVSDVLERARLQEESLKLSSSKFFYDAARTFPRGNRSSSACTQNSNLTKPASVEALYANNRKQNSVGSSINIAQKKFTQSSPNQSPFGSTASLNFPTDLHRSSLPNLNKGYNSLRVKKPKRTSEPHIQCPLPIYPRTGTNASMKSEVSHSSTKSTLRSPINMYRESQTLPSSYRTRSRNSSMNKVEPQVTPKRRDSSPSPLCQRNNLMVHPFRRESSPCVAQRSARKNAGILTIHGDSMPVLQNTRSLSVNQLSSESDSDHQREGNSRHFYSKRQPLSSVHNCSLKQEDYSIIHNNGELRKSTLPSKIPSPSNRSGIPVPSAQYTVDKSSPNKESWSQDFY